MFGGTWKSAQAYGSYDWTVEDRNIGQEHRTGT